MTKILFLDCDGTIREPKSGAKFINNPDDQRIITGADKAIAYYHSEGYKIIGITNQAGVAAGHKTLENAILEQQITLKLIPQISCIYFCPDFEGKDCWNISRKYPENPSPIHETWGGKWIGQYRKPGAGMLQAAAMNYGLQIAELVDCWMIGDRDEDAAAAINANVKFLTADIWRSRFN